MLFAGSLGRLEARSSEGGSVRLRGRFPYNAIAVLSDGGRAGGRPKKEIIAPKAFAYRVDKVMRGRDPSDDIHLLSGHRYDKPLASVRAGTLTLEDTAEALTFEAVLPPEVQEISWVRDLLAALAAGLVVGLSPGFRLPPKRAVEVAEKIEQEANDPSRGMHGAIIRTILAALLYEISIVTRPAYDMTQVELRNWTPPERQIGHRNLQHHLNRWRA